MSDDLDGLDLDLGLDDLLNDNEPPKSGQSVNKSKDNEASADADDAFAKRMAERKAARKAAEAEAEAARPKEDKRILYDKMWREWRAKQVFSVVLLLCFSFYC